MILLSSFTLALTGCETVTIKNRTACHLNGKLAYGAGCSTTVGTSIETQLDMDGAIRMLEETPADPKNGTEYRAPAIFESAKDYGEETDELNVACRILGNSCSYELQTTIKNRQALLKEVGAR